MFPGRQFFPAAILVVLCGSGIAGCGDRSGGSPQSSNDGGSATVSSPTSAKPQAPTVEHPLRPGRYTDEPCALLTSEQMQDFGFASSTKPDSRENAAGGMTCSWSDYAHGGVTTISLGWLPDNEAGLGSTYAQRQEFEQNGYFEPTTVSGYPAVYASKDDDRADGVCVLDVGVNEHVELLTDANTAPDIRAKACSMAKSAAAAAIETLQKGD